MPRCSVWLADVTRERASCDRQWWSPAHLGPGVLVTGACSHSMVWGFTGPPLWPVSVRCGQIPRQALPWPGTSLEEEVSLEDPSTQSWLTGVPSVHPWDQRACFSLRPTGNVSAADCRFPAPFLYFYVRGEVFITLTER